MLCVRGSLNLIFATLLQTTIYNTKHHQKAKHIKTQYLFVWNDMVQQGQLKVVYIPGKDQPGDMLTKQLPINQFTKHYTTLEIGN